MGQAPIVTVIIPTFNRAQFVADAVESVLNQSLQPVEIIVVDDGSTDDTEHQLRKYDGRITYVRSSRGGPAHARNIGMRQARGTYIAFLDSDDRYYPYKLELQARILDLFPDVGMTYSEVSGFDDSGFRSERHLRAYHESAYRDLPAGYGQLFEATIDLRSAGLLDGLPIDPAMAAGAEAYVGNIHDTYLTRLIVFTNSMLFRRSLLAEVGYQDPSLTLFEDLDFALRLCRRHRVCFVDIPTYELRYHPGQMSTTAGTDGKRVWIRKQQHLLRVIRREARADPQHYEASRAALDSRLAHLNRAVAVALLLLPGRTPVETRRSVMLARAHLARSQRLGHPERTLNGLSFLPGPLRRLGVTIVEKARRL